MPIKPNLDNSLMIDILNALCHPKCGEPNFLVPLFDIKVLLPLCQTIFNLWHRCGISSGARLAYSLSRAGSRNVIFIAVYAGKEELERKSQTVYCMTISTIFLSTENNDLIFVHFVLVFAKCGCFFVNKSLLSRFNQL